MQRLAILVYGLVCYVLFLGAFVYAVLFVEGLYVPRTIDAGGTLSPAWRAAAVDVLLLGLFGLQHSVMARRGFKARWTRVVHPAIERSTFVLATVLVLAAIFRFWRPIPTVVWDADGAAALALRALSWAGFGLVLVATFVIDHFELFGLKQPLRFAQGRTVEPARFQVRLFYRYVRHPLYLGFFVAFWSVTVPGPETFDHANVRARFDGTPSSHAVPASVAFAGRTIVCSAPASTSGASFVGTSSGMPSVPTVRS